MYTPSDRAAHNMTEYGVCSCEDGWQQCDEDAAGPPNPTLTLETGHKIANISSSPFTTPDYLLRSHADYIRNRLVKMASVVEPFNH